MKNKQVIIVAACPTCGNQKWISNEKLVGEFQCIDCNSIVAPEDMVLTELVAAEAEGYPVALGTCVFELRVRNKQNGYRHNIQIVSKYQLHNVLHSNTDEIYIAEKEFRKSDKARWDKTVFATYKEAEDRLKQLKMCNNA